MYAHSVAYGIANLLINVIGQNLWSPVQAKTERPASDCPDDVVKADEKKGEKEEKVRCLEEEITGLEKAALKEHGKKLLDVQKQLGKKKAELKDRKGKLKSLKGQPVTLKKFLEEVVLPHCELCPQ